MNTKENFKDKLVEQKVWLRNISISIILHTIVIILLFYAIILQPDKSKINPGSLFFEVDEYQSVKKTFEEITSEENKSKEIKQPETPPVETKTSNFVTFSEITADTTDLYQVYHESTLNLSINYPKGWVFIDQKKKNKLDGVTFWATDSNINPPPYIHLEVLDKYLFNEKRFKYKLELKDNIAYYNESEEIAGQVSQTFYIRTDDEEDYNIKLIINGMDSFKSFQPKFLAILKSFSLGNGFLHTN